MVILGLKGGQTMRWIAGIFIISHGLVHAWYITLSQGWVAFQPDMGWTGRSWVLSGFLGEPPIRLLASALYLVAGSALVVSGVGMITQAGWGQSPLMISAAFSAAVILLFWDGGFGMPVQKGLLGLVIDLGIIGVIALSG
jgi:hypothetical protein